MTAVKEHAGVLRSESQSRGPSPKVLFLSSIMQSSDTRAGLFMTALVEAGCEVVAIMPRGAAECEVPAAVRRRYLPPVSKNFWPNSRLFDLLAALWQRFRNSVIATRRAVQEKGTLCITHEPDSWFVGWIAKWWTGAALVADLPEIYEDRVQAFPRLLRGPANRIIRWLLGYLARRSDCVIHVNEEQKEHYALPALRQAVIHHYAPGQWFQSLSPTRPDGCDGSFIVIHAGPLEPAVGAVELLSAVELASREVPNLICLVVGGTIGPSRDFKCQLQRLLEENKLILLPYTEHRKVLALILGSSVGLTLPLPVDTNHRLASPTKLYEYLCAGLPVIGSRAPEVHQVLTAFRCGLIVNGQDPSEIAGAIVKLARDENLRREMSVNARRAARDFLNWESEQEKLLRLVENLSSRRLSSPAIAVKT